ncbi:MAG: FkbM family methyltransferase [Bryobacteraceae bacterium]
MWFCYNILTPMTRRLTAALILLVLLLTGWRYRKIVLWTALTALGRNPYCSIASVFASPRNFVTIDSGVERTRARCKIVKREARFWLWDTPMGHFWAPAPSTFVPFDVFEQETDIYGSGRDGVQRADIVIDCGANIGLFTAKALKLGAGRVIAVEPGPENLECLQRNLAAEIQAGRVLIVRKGVWSREGFLRFISEPDNSAGDHFVDSDVTSGVGQQLPITTIDRIVADLKLPHVDFIKMDIEGSEVPAIAGATETLRASRPRLAICTYHKLDDPVTIPAAIRKINPAYIMRCGGCQRRGFSLEPLVLLFK